MDSINDILKKTGKGYETKEDEKEEDKKDEDKK